MRQTTATVVLFAISVQNRSENDKNEPQKKNTHTQHPEGTAEELHHPNIIDKSEPLIASDVRGIIKNSSKTDDVKHRGSLWPEITPNATETAHLELLGGLGSAMCRNDPKWYQNKPFGTSGRLGPKWSTTAGPEMVQNATETIRN